MAGYDIHTAYTKWKGGVLTKSREEFIKEVTDIVLLALFRTGGSITGMVVGQVVIPIPVVGGLVGAVVGVLGGHLLGKFVSEKCADSIAHLIESKGELILEKAYDVMSAGIHLPVFPEFQRHPLETASACNVTLKWAMYDVFKGNILYEVT